MKKWKSSSYILLVLLVLAGCTPNSTKVTQSSGNTTGPISAIASAPAESADQLENFRRLLETSDLGFVSQYYSADLVAPLESTPEPVPPESAEFYSRFVGSYAASANLSDASPLNNLVRTNFRWGTGYYFEGDFKGIVWLSDTNQFFAPHGDSDGAQIKDLSAYQLPPDWVLLSSPKDPGSVIQKILESKKIVLQDQSIGRDLDEDKKETLKKLYRTTILAIHTKDFADSPVVSFSSDIDKNVLDGLAADVNTYRLKHGVYVVYNGYQNENATEFRKKFKEMILLEFCFKDDSEFFSLGFLPTETGYILSYVRNGMSDL